MKSQNTLLILFSLLFFPYVLFAYNIRQISSKDGLVNSAVLTLQQAQNGELFIGTCDGVNIFNGKNIKSINASADKDNNLLGNLITKIIETEPNIFWIQSNFGLDRYDRINNTIKHFKEFNDNNSLTKDNHNNLFVFNSDNTFHIYNEEHQKFYSEKVNNLDFYSVIGITIDSNNKLWTFLNNGTAEVYSFSIEEEKLTIKKEQTTKFCDSFVFCQIEQDNIYYLDQNATIYKYNLLTKEEIYVKNINSLVDKQGTVSSILEVKSNYFISFQKGGLYCLKYTPEKKEKYEINTINISAGIFTLLKDKNQDIIWIATDGQGVLMYSEEPYTFRSFTSSSISNYLKNPIRALFLDRNKKLWIGTKGDGLFSFENFDINLITSETKISHYNTQNNQFIDNYVYEFAYSDKDVFWIGSDAGLSYYSYDDNKIHHLLVNNLDLKYIHSIFEVNHNTLWIATLGCGYFKVTLKWNNNTPSIISTQRYTHTLKGKERNHFFSLLYDDKSEQIYLGNRGAGVIIHNTKNDKVKTLLLDSVSENETINEVFALYKDNQNNLWIGTSFGLVKHTVEKKNIIYNNKNGFPNHTIHQIQKGENDNHLWLSTNNGIINFNIDTENFQVYDYNNSLSITEFSDGASFKYQNTVFFGGVNGFATITNSSNKNKKSHYVPPIQFSDLKIFGEKKNIYDVQQNNDSLTTIKLKFNQNFFSFNFTAVDFINGNNYNYFYKFARKDNQWINNGTQNTISFTNLSPGKYFLETKYINRTTGEQSEIHPITIIITPPWYASYAAYTFYIFLTLLLIYYAFKLYINRKKRATKLTMDRIEQKHQKEVYESKLQFFTNIAHEFCTPLTLIYGPCNRILSHKETNSFTKKHTQLIQRNAQRLNKLIQELIEFRKIETGNREPIIEELNIKQLILTELEAFTDVAKQNDIKLEYIIPSNITWNSDEMFFRTIIINLLSNAFKYTEREGNICITIDPSPNYLIIRIKNNSHNINKEDLEHIFDRYKILEGFENQDQNSFSRNGLGLAILKSMISLLKGKITAQLNDSDIVEFIISLPKLEVSKNININKNTQLLNDIFDDTSDLDFKFPEENFNPLKPTLLIIDDDKEVLWLLSDTFHKKFNIKPMFNAIDALDSLNTDHPDLIICDIMMPKLDGISFTKKIKNNPNTSHIPLILISAKHEVEEQIEGLNAGAEMYITKPFNIDYLETSINQLINRKETLKDYFGSPLSAYKLVEFKYTHKEHKKFIKQIYSIINDNLTNKKLNVQFIADKLNISTRHLYRKLEDIGEEKSPANMIKESRLYIAQDLLLTTKLNIDEVIYKSGFASKGTFYSSFTEIYNCTPKEYRDKNNSNIDKPH